MAGVPAQQQYLAERSDAGKDGVEREQEVGGGVAERVGSLSLLSLAVHGVMAVQGFRIGVENHFPVRAFQISSRSSSPLKGLARK